MMNCANEAPLLTIVGSDMLMIYHTGAKAKSLPNLRECQPAIEVHPLPTIIRPCLTTEGLAKPRIDKCVLKGLQMLAGHTFDDSKLCEGGGLFGEQQA